MAFASRNGRPPPAPAALPHLCARAARPLCPHPRRAALADPRHAISWMAELQSSRSTATRRAGDELETVRLPSFAPRHSTPALSARAMMRTLTHRDDPLSLLSALLSSCYVLLPLCLVRPVPPGEAACQRLAGSPALDSWIAFPSLRCDSVSMSHAARRFFFPSALLSHNPLLRPSDSPPLPCVVLMHPRACFLARSCAPLVPFCAVMSYTRSLRHFLLHSILASAAISRHPSSA